MDEDIEFTKNSAAGPVGAVALKKLPSVRVENGGAAGIRLRRGVSQVSTRGPRIALLISIKE
jgi:hypothetical protein